MLNKILVDEGWEIMNLFDEATDDLKLYPRCRQAFGGPRLPYVENRYNAPLKIAQEMSGREKPLFLEFGCGLGKNVLRNALRGFDSYGVEMRLNLVNIGNEFIDKLKSEGYIDDSVQARLFYGNIFTKDILEELVDRLCATLIARRTEQASQASPEKQGEEWATMRSNIEAQLEKGLEFLTDEETQRCPRITTVPKRIGSQFCLGRATVPKRVKVQRFELNCDEGDMDTILENPYSKQGLDVYDVMGLDFGQFDVFYGYSYSNENNPYIACMIYRHHPRPYIWHDPAEYEYSPPSSSGINHMTYMWNELPLQERMTYIWSTELPLRKRLGYSIKCFLKDKFPSLRIRGTFPSSRT